MVVVGYDTNQVEGFPSAEVSGVVLKASNIASTTSGLNSAVITWQMNKPADTQVEYGTSTAYGSMTALNSALVLNHSQSLNNLIAGSTYHYRIRSRDEGGSTFVSPDYTFSSTMDTVPPSDVKLFSAIPGNAQVTLSCTNPADNDFKGVMIRYRTDGTFPANKNDGILVANRTGIPSENDSFVHAGLSNGTTYFYSAFSYDTSQNFSSTAHTQATPNEVAILSLSPTQGNKGIEVSINGKGFGPTQGTSTVTFSGVPAAVSAWSSNSITATVPEGARSGPVIVTANKVQSNGVTFKIGGKLAAPGRIRVKN